MSLQQIYSDELARCTFAERHQVEAWIDAIKLFDSLGGGTAAFQQVKITYGHLIDIKPATFYRRRTAFRDKGMLSLMRASTRRRVTESLPLAPAFVRFWQLLCLENQRKSAPAWRTLIDDHLCAGREIPGYGADWRSVWIHDRPGWPVPQRCPYSLSRGVFPDGWTERNLSRYAPNQFALAAGRMGMAAARAFVPDIPTTRVGLPFGRVFVIDDVEWDNKVTFLGNRNPQGVVELGALELLTGHYCTWGAKPIRERADGSREKVKETFNRYLIAHIVCGIGYSTEGCLICGEHGTAKVEATLAELLDKRSGGNIKFSAGGIQSKPLAAGMWLGLRRGNFRFKAALESHHNLKKNEQAQLEGQKGADPAHAPEDLTSREQYHVSLMKACIALATERPDLITQIRSPFPPYQRQLEAVTALYDRISHRTDHDLEGWEACGFVTQLWRVPGHDVWSPMTSLDSLDEIDRGHILQIIERNPAKCLKLVRMSPIEAWHHARGRAEAEGRLVRLPDSMVPEILGPELGHVVPAQDNMTFAITDPCMPGRTQVVAGLVQHPDGSVENLERGRQYLVHLNPYDGRYAHISTPQGVYLGRAPVMLPGTKIDTEAFHRNIKITSAIVANETKALAPLAEKRLRDRAEMNEQNVRALTGRGSQDVITAQQTAAAHSDDADDALDELYGRK